MPAISKGPPQNYRRVIDVVEEVLTVSGYGPLKMASMSLIIKCFKRSRNH